MASFFDSLGSLGQTSELGGTTTVGSTASGAATGFMIGGPVGAGAGAVLGFGLGLAAERQKRKAAARVKETIKQERAQATQNRNTLVEQNFKKRSSAAGMGSRSPGQDKASGGVSLLASTETNTPSLFG